VKPLLMVCDPSYDVEFDPDWRKRASVSNSDRMGRSPTMTGRPGAPPGLSFAVMWHMFGTERCTPQ
jgi:hypothetical protein